MSWPSCWDVEGMVVEQQLDETAAEPEAAVQALTETHEQVVVQEQVF